MSLRTPAEMKMEPALTPIQPFPVEGKGFDPLLPSQTVSQRMGSGVSSRTNVRDLRFLPAVEMTERLTRRCFRYWDTVCCGDEGGGPARILFEIHLMRATNRSILCIG